jgi:type I restriction enzyme S subunit
MVEDYSKILSGFAFKSSLFNKDGLGTPIIRIRDVGAKQSSTYFNGAYDDKFLISSGDFLIAMDGEFRLERWTGPSSLLNQRVCKITFDNDVDSEYMMYLLPKQLKLIEDQTSFVTVKHLSVKKIRAIQIPLPPLPTQTRIARALDLADRHRRLLREELDAYDRLGESLFLEMFGDPVTNPKRWKSKTFADVGQLDRGKSKHRPRNDPRLLGGPYPLIQTGDVANSEGYITSYTSTYSEVGLKQSRLWESGTLCITIAANIAKTGILTFEACFPDSVVGFLPNDSTNVEYVQMWLSFLQKILEDKAPESAQKNINLKILRNLEFMSPPLPLQTEFAKRIKKINLLKAKAQATLKEADDLFNALLQRAFRGELFVE